MNPPSIEDFKRLIDQGKYQEAFYVNKIILNHLKELYYENRDDPYFVINFANQLLNQSYLCMNSQNCKEEALSHANTAVLVAQSMFGPNHEKVAPYFRQLADVYFSQSFYADAETNYKKVLNALSIATEPNASLRGEAYCRLGRSHHLMKQHPEARLSYKQGLNIYYDNCHPSNFDSILIWTSELTSILMFEGRYREADEFCSKAYFICRERRGSHNAMARMLNQYASLKQNQSDFEKAEALFLEGIEILRIADCKDKSKLLANITAALGQLYTKLRKYEKAYVNFKTALSLCEGNKDLDKSDVACVLGSYALYLGEIQDIERAEYYTKKARDIVTDIPELFLIFSLQLTMFLLQRKGRGADCEDPLPIIKEALSGFEKMYGADHPILISYLINLSLYYAVESNFTSAREYAEKALRIAKRHFGPASCETTKAFSVLGCVYVLSGQYSKALPYLEDALNIQKNILKYNDEMIEGDYFNLAVSYTWTGKYSKAFVYFVKSLSAGIDVIGSIMATTSDDQKLTFIKSYHLQLGSFINFIAVHLHSNGQALRQAYTYWLRTKGVVLEVQKRFHEAMFLDDDSSVIAAFKELSDIKKELVRLIIPKIFKADDVVDQEHIKELKAKKNALEIELSQKSNTFKLFETMRNFDAKTLSDIIPDENILIDFVRLPFGNFDGFKWQIKDRYYAFLIQPSLNENHISTKKLHYASRAAGIQLIDLGDAEYIDGLVHKLKEHAVIFDNNRGQVDLTIIDTSEASHDAAPYIEPDLKNIANTLYSRIFEPFKPYLGNKTKLLVSPDGQLNLIPFEILVDECGNYLIDKFSFTYVAAGREIAVFGQPPANTLKSLILADPDFDVEIQKNNTDNESISHSFGLKKFLPLGGTRKEAQAVSQLLGSQETDMYVGSEATESLLMKTKSPKFLHLSTHGFFEPDQARKYNSIEMLPQYYTLSAQDPIGTPLSCSGLALAGANRALLTLSSEGIVTAEKVLNLRLRGTEMVVLSACETGLGDVKNGEGVFGLRRAFAQVGAQSMVMSMWQVPENETKDLMIIFYDNIINKKMDRCEALRQAALSIKNQIRDARGHTHPFFWGAFVFSGDPGDIHQKQA